MRSYRTDELTVVDRFLMIFVLVLVRNPGTRLRQFSDAGKSNFLPWRGLEGGAGRAAGGGAHTPSLTSIAPVGQLTISFASLHSISGGAARVGCTLLSFEGTPPVVLAFVFQASR
jgi:hypothetical protein